MNVKKDVLEEVIMHVKSKGYISGAFLLLPAIRKMRDHLELEKFICRVLKDDERTQKFRKNTETHRDPIHALRYNKSAADRMTAAGRKKITNAPQ